MLGVFIRCAGRALERPFGAVNDVGGDSVGLGAVAGEMCWPRERPATSAARWILSHSHSAPSRRGRDEYLRFLFFGFVEFS